MRLSRHIKWRESCTSRVVLPAPVCHCTISSKLSEAMAATHFSHLQREILGFTRLGFPEVQRKLKSYALPTFQFKKPYNIPPSFGKLFSKDQFELMVFKCHCLRKCSRGQKLWSTNLAETWHRSWV